MKFPGVDPARLTRRQFISMLKELKSKPSDRDDMLASLMEDQMQRMTTRGR